MLSALAVLGLVTTVVGKVIDTSNATQNLTSALPNSTPTALPTEEPTALPAQILPTETRLAPTPTTQSEATATSAPLPTETPVAPTPTTPSEATATFVPLPTEKPLAPTRAASVSKIPTARPVAVIIQRAGVAKPTATPAPTAVVEKAPWAAEMTQQPDGSWMASKPIVDKVIADVAPFYTDSRNRSLAAFLKVRNQIVETYFTGDALQQMQTYETNRAKYGVNKAGVIVVTATSFSEDGFTAQVSIAVRGWVNDIYDVATKKLVTRGAKQQDLLTNVAVRYDAAQGRWKIEKFTGSSLLNQ